MELMSWQAQHTNAGGVVSLQYPLNDHSLGWGEWTIQAKIRNHVYNNTFRVQEFCKCVLVSYSEAEFFIVLVRQSVRLVGAIGARVYKL